MLPILVLFQLHLMFYLYCMIILYQCMMHLQTVYGYSHTFKWVFRYDVIVASSKGVLLYSSKI